MEFLYQKFKIADLKKIAKERGGECLSTEYTGLYSRYEWKCKRKHIWTNNFYSIYVGTWCNKCYTIERIKKSVAKIIEFAISKGGKCLTPKVESYDAMVKLKCSKGHVWEIKPYLRDAKLWCPICNKK